VFGRILETSDQLVFGKQRADSGLLDAAALAVDDAHGQDSLFAAESQIIGQQTGDFPGLKGMQIQDTVDGYFNGFHAILVVPRP